MSELTFSSLCETGLQFYFVSNDGEPNTNFPDLILCFERLIETFDSLNTCKWISINLCETLAKTRTLTRKQVFVFGEFEGITFENLKKTKALILGPRCIMSCLVSNCGIPNSKTPVFNINMRDLCVCTSGMSPTEKNKLQTLVNYMGGYSEGNELTVATTHLVTNTIMSKKYEKAVIHKMETMRPDWVYDMWKQCQTSNINSNSSEIIEKYKVPIFYRLGITTTGLMTSIKQNFKKLIEQNGGRFYGYFKSELIDVILMNRGDIHSDKYKAAVKCKKLCLTPDWITNSLAKGYALPVMDYRVNDLITPPPSRVPSEMGCTGSSSGSCKIPAKPALKISTPTKTDKPLPINESAFNQNCTAISMILNNETINESKQAINDVTPPAVSSDLTSYKNILANINLRDARSAGLFLDGCNIFLCGFTSNELTKITRIIGTSGALHFTEFNSKVSYIIVGSLNESEMEFLSSIHDYCTLVKVDWLFASINLKQPAPEKEFLIILPDKRKKLNGNGCSGNGKTSDASPASKKNIELMTMGFRKPLAPKRLNLDDKETTVEQIANKKQRGEEEDLLSQYLIEAAVVSPKSLRAKSTAESVTTTSITTTTTTTTAIAAITADQVKKTNQNLKSPENLPNNQLTVANNESEFTEDYTDGWTESLDFLTGKTVVIHGFVEESYELIIKQINAAGGKIIIDYSNQSLMIDYLIVATDILNIDVTVNAKFTVNDLWLQESITDNKCAPIKYYHHPIIHNEQSKPLAGNMIVLTTYTGHEREYLTILATCLGGDVEEKYFKAQNPILICPRPEGAKYNGAIKWHLPVTTCEWLLECLRTSEKVPMRPYLVGESILPKDEIENELKVLETTMDPAIDNIPNCDEDKNKCNTPILLKHNRLTDLQNSAKQVGINSPISPADKIAEYVKDLPTPKRKLIYDQLKDVNNDLTPFSKRQRLEMDTPELVKVLDERVTPIIKAKQDEILRTKVIQKSKAKATTPFSEFKKKFWKDALGDSYEHSMYTQNSQSDSVLAGGSNVSINKITNSNSTTSSTSTKTSRTTATKTTSDETVSNNEHIQRFTEFIKKNRESSSSPANAKIIVPPRNLDQQETPHISDDIAETLQNYAIGWKDPLDFFDTHRFKNRNHMQYSGGTPRFNISCSDLQINETIQKQIGQLNGEICVHLSGYDRTCTHVLCQLPNRSEKIFSAIAAGRWVLSINYIKDSIVAGHFLNEESYEWGNPKAIENLPDIEDDNIKQTARAAYRWRQKIQSKFLNERNQPGPSNRVSAILTNPDSYGAFENFKVILHMVKKASFIKLLEAGGGTVLELSEPYAQYESDVLRNATHCILDTKCKLTEIDRKIFKENNVPCCNISFLQAYITADTIPNVENFRC